MKNTQDKIDKKIFVIIGFGLAYIFLGLSFLMNKIPFNTAQLIGVFLVLIMGAGFIIWAIFNKEKKL